MIYHEFYFRQDTAQVSKDRLEDGSTGRNTDVFSDPRVDSAVSNNENPQSSSVSGQSSASEPISQDSKDPEPSQANSSTSPEEKEHSFDSTNSKNTPESDSPAMLSTSGHQSVSSLRQSSSPLPLTIDTVDSLENHAVESESSVFNNSLLLSRIPEITMEVLPEEKLPSIGIQSNCSSQVSADQPSDKKGDLTVRKRDIPRTSREWKTLPNTSQPRSSSLENEKSNQLVFSMIIQAEEEKVETGDTSSLNDKSGLVHNPVSKMDNETGLSLHAQSQNVSSPGDQSKSSQASTTDQLSPSPLPNPKRLSSIDNELNSKDHLASPQKTVSPSSITHSSSSLPLPETSVSQPPKPDTSKDFTILNEQDLENISKEDTSTPLNPILSTLQNPHSEVPPAGPKTNAKREELNLLIQSVRYNTVVLFRFDKI